MFDQKVKLEPQSHKYYNAAGEEYMSFSSVYGLISKPFDRNLAHFVAKAEGTSAAEILNKWDSSTELGVRIDEALVKYKDNKDYAAADLDIKDLVESVLEEYKDYHKCFEQVVVYNDEFRTAGSLDKGFLYSNRKDSSFGLADYKCWEKDNIYETRGWLKEPFTHLPLSKFTKASFQLSYYAYHLEQLTGKKCKELFIHVIKPTEKKHFKVYVPYLRADIEMLLNSKKEEIKQLLGQSFITVL